MALEPQRRRRPTWRAVLPFALSHVAVLGAVWSGVTVEALVCCAVLYVVRMFAVTAGYHRYFSHRTFKMGRAGQFALAFLAQTSSQKGVLWWAAHHRRHHRWSDTDRDVHSPVRRGFWYAHVGWIYDGNDETDFDRVRDLARYPELVWLNRYWYVPPAMLGLATWLTLGWPGLFVGFFLSTVLLWHGTFFINSLAHVVGRRRYETGDESRNSLVLALLTLGEGWHNNHHRYPGSTRQGFFWWEIDVTWMILRGLERLGLVSDLRGPPPRILAEGRAADRRSPAPAKSGRGGPPLDPHPTS